MPSVAEETKAVPETETNQAVPPPVPGKGSEPGLGEKVDLYDSQKVTTPGPLKSDKKKLEESQEAVRKHELLGHETAPQPTTTPPPQELPFLKPLGRNLGRSIDATV
jgi:hypothetical protein